MRAGQCEEVATAGGYRLTITSCSQALANPATPRKDLLVDSGKFNEMFV